MRGASPVISTVILVAVAVVLAVVVLKWIEGMISFPQQTPDTEIKMRVLDVRASPGIIEVDIVNTGKGELRIVPGEAFLYLYDSEGKLACTTTLSSPVSIPHNGLGVLSFDTSGCTLADGTYRARLSVGAFTTLLNVPYKEGGGGGVV